jgi:hypothetical protein
MPKISEFGLSANIPDGELETLIVDLLDVEADSGD